MSLTWSPELLRRQTKAKDPAQSRADANGTIQAFHTARLHQGNANADKQRCCDDDGGDCDGVNAGVGHGHGRGHCDMAMAMAMVVVMVMKMVTVTLMLMLMLMLSKTMVMVTW